MACKLDYKLIKHTVHDEDGDYADGWLVVDQHYDGENNCDYYAQVYSREVGQIVVKALQRSR